MAPVVQRDTWHPAELLQGPRGSVEVGLLTISAAGGVGGDIHRDAGDGHDHVDQVGDRNRAPGAGEVHTRGISLINHKAICGHDITHIEEVAAHRQVAQLQPAHTLAARLGVGDLATDRREREAIVLPRAQLVEGTKAEHPEPMVTLTLSAQLIGSNLALGIRRKRVERGVLRDRELLERYAPVLLAGEGNHHSCLGGLAQHGVEYGAGAIHVDSPRALGVRERLSHRRRTRQTVDGGRPDGDDHLPDDVGVGDVGWRARRPRGRGLDDVGSQNAMHSDAIGQKRGSEVSTDEAGEACDKDGHEWATLPRRAGDHTRRARIHSPGVMSDLIPGGTAPIVWICLPTYNEAENLRPMVESLLAMFDSSGMDGHVLVIDDDSLDGTGTIADDLAAGEDRVEVLHWQHRQGLGPAYRDGFRTALARGADLIVEMGCDCSHYPAALPTLVSAARTADVVLGSRYVRNGRAEDWSLLRRLISRGGCVYPWLALGIAPHDITSGFKCFRREVLEAIPLDEVGSPGYVFQVEMTYRAILMGYRVVEVPITFRDRRRCPVASSWRPPCTCRAFADDWAAPLRAGQRPPSDVPMRAGS